MKHLLKYYPQIWNNWEQIILICKIFKKTTICFPPKQKPQIRSNNFPDYSNKAFQRSSTPSILPFNPFLNSTDSALFVPLLQMVQHHSGVHPSIHPFPQKRSFIARTWIDFSCQPKNPFENWITAPTTDNSSLCWRCEFGCSEQTHFLFLGRCHTRYMVLFVFVFLSRIFFCWGKILRQGLCAGEAEGITLMKICGQLPGKQFPTSERLLVECNHVSCRYH